jgi:hypothetical protein
VQSSDIREAVTAIDLKAESAVTTIAQTAARHPTTMRRRMATWRIRCVSMGDAVRLAKRLRRRGALTPCDFAKLSLKVSHDASN